MEVIEAVQYTKKIEQAIVELLEEFERESGLVMRRLIGSRSGPSVAPEGLDSGHIQVVITAELPVS